MADINYEIKPTLPLTAPKGKLPYIKDDDIILGDSAFLILHLKAYYKNLDEQLSAARAGNIPIRIGKLTSKLFLAECHLSFVT